MDVNGDGYLTPGEFKRALEKLGVAAKVPKRAIRAIFAHFDSKNSKRVSWRDFVRFATRRQSTAGFAMERLRRTVWQTDPVTVFQDMDKNGDGKLSRKEFRDGLRSLGLGDLDADQTKSLVGAFSRDGSDTVDLRAFIMFASSARSDTTSRIAEVEKKLRRLANRDKVGVSLGDSFKHFDKNKDGRIEFHEFNKAMAQLASTPGFSGTALTTSDTRQIFDNFDVECNGFIDYTDFVTYFSKSLREEDDASASRSGGSLNVDAKPVQEEELREMLHAVTRSAAREGHNISGEFEHYDTVPLLFRISKDAFERALQNCGFFLTGSQCRWLCAKFASSANQVMSPMEISWTGRPRSRQSRANCRETARHDLGGRQSAEDTRAMFAIFTANTGRVTPAAFKDGLNKLQLQTSLRMRSVYSSKSSRSMKMETYPTPTLSALFMVMRLGHRKT